MLCKQCPYGEIDFQCRIYNYFTILEKYGYPNDVYGYLTPEEHAEESERFIRCDKVDGKVCWAGYCSEAYEEPVFMPQKSRRKKKSKRERDLCYKRHIKRLASSICVSRPASVSTRNPEYYKRLYRSQHSSYLKKVANRKVRRYKDAIFNGNDYRKVYDFWYKYWW